MYTVTKTYGHELGLSATFRQHRAKSHCRFIHGYALGFKIVFGARQLDENGWVKDFGSLKPLKQRLIDTFDHRMLVAQDDPCRQFLESLNSQDWSYANGHDQLAQVIVLPAVGCEAFARMVYGWAADTRTEDDIRRGVHVLEVECREHAGNAASYTGSF